jgi:hypothetical protein
MTIPYGAIALLSGLVALVFKAPAVGVQLAGAGGVVSLCSVLSLKSWKAGGGSTPYTLISAGECQESCSSGGSSSSSSKRIVETFVHILLNVL